MRVGVVEKRERGRDKGGGGEREKERADLLIQTTRHKGKMSVGFKKFKPLSADFNTR